MSVHPCKACPIRLLPCVHGDEEENATPECLTVLLYSIFPPCSIVLFKALYTKKKEKCLDCIVKSEVKVAKRSKQMVGNR